MAENKALTEFLAQETAADAPQAPVEPPATATPPAEPAAPSPAQKPAAKAPEAKQPEPDDDHVEGVSGDDHRTVPMAALDKIRNDWKSKFTASEARAAELAKQLEEAKRPPAPPQPAPQHANNPLRMPPMPDPNIDLHGYLAWQHELSRRQALNDRLNISEMMVREKIGDAALESYVADFQEYLKRDSSLEQKLYAQPAPYQWMTKEVDRLRLLNEVGDDPAAWRAKIAAEERAKWEAERAQQQPPTITQSPAAGLPPSLANVRSAAGRTSPTWTGPTTDADLVGMIRHERVAARRR